MKPPLLMFLVALGQVCTAAGAQDRSTISTHLNAEGGRVYITHVTVIDTGTGKEAKDRTVVLSGDRIFQITDGKGVRFPADARVVDGKGKYLIPGLWDMHAHGTDIDSTFPLYLTNGVTGVREMSGPPDSNIFRAELSAKKSTLRICT